MPDVLFVSKPVAPPWDDSNKNLVRDVAANLKRYHPRVMVPRGTTLDGVTCEPLYADTGSYTPSRLANARVLARLVTGSRVDVWHFFFAPNPLTLRAGALAKSLRRTASVHTIASAPEDLERVALRLFADRVVALSAHTHRRLARVGVEATVIPPALPMPDASPAAVEAARARYGLPERYVLYPGDLEVGNGAKTFVDAAAQYRDVGWVVAARPKTPRAADSLRYLQARARDANADVVWLGRIEDIHAVIAGASVVVLATDSLQAKMDWPIVLLEALLLGVPVVVGEATPAAELTSSGAAFSVASGDAAAVVSALRDWHARGHDARATALAEARDWVFDRCAPQTVARAYERVYDELLEATARASASKPRAVGR